MLLFSKHTVHVVIGFVITLHTDVRDKYEKTPLHTACESGHKEVVQYLVEKVKCDVGEYLALYNVSRFDLNISRNTCSCRVYIQRSPIGACTVYSAAH